MSLLRFTLTFGLLVFCPPVAAENDFTTLSAAERGTCSWAMRALRLGSQARFLASANTILESAASHRNHGLDNPQNPFVLGARYYSQSLGRWRTSLVERNSGIVLTVEDGELVARFSRCACGVGNPLEEIRIPFPTRYRLDSSEFSIDDLSPAFSPFWDLESYHFISRILRYGLMDQLLAVPTEHLSRFFLDESYRLYQQGFMRLAVLPISLVEGGIPESDNPIRGIQLEGLMRFPLTDGTSTERYVVIQGVIRHGTFQVWWADSNGRIRFISHPVNWAFDSKGEVRSDLVNAIYRDALKLNESQDYGLTYSISQGQRDMSVTVLSLCHQLGWTLPSPERQPLSYLGQTVVVVHNAQPVLFGKVVEASGTSELPSGALHTDLVVEVVDSGVRYEVSSLDVRMSQ